MITQINKFEDLNGQFVSLGTGMTHPNKFKDRQCTLLFEIYACSVERDKSIDNKKKK
jgi:hypothetical protein